MNIIMELGKFNETLPQNLNAIPSDNQISLTWVASSTPNVKYYIFRNLVRGSHDYSNPLDKDINGINFIDNTVVNGKRYFYVVVVSHQKLTGLCHEN